jgi:hypothetical protein
MIRAATLTEDRRLLVTAHTEANRVTLWDVQTGTKVRDLACEAPTFLLARREQLIVALGAAGNLSVFDASNGWKRMVDMPAGRKDVTFLSAPLAAA